MKRGGPQTTAASACQGKSVRCDKQARLKDAWRAINGGCGATPVRGVPSAPAYVMPFAALNHQLDADNDGAWAELNVNTTRVAAMMRRNKLDQLICQIKDCFDKHAGFPVNAAGRRVKSLCFKRRATGKTDAVYKVKIDPDKLRKRIRQHAGGRTGEVWWAHEGGAGFAAHGFGSTDYFTGHVETLTGFEYAADRNDSRWHKSQESFVKMLESLGAPASPAVVLRVMRRYATDAATGRPQAARKQHSHRNEIFNDAEVREALRGTEWEWMWHN